MAPNPGSEPQPLDAPKPAAPPTVAPIVPPRRVSMMDIQRTDVSSRRLKRRLTVVAGVVLLAGAVVVAVLRLGPSVPTVDKRSLQIDSVVEGELIRRVRGSGTLVSRHQERVVALASGRVQSDPAPLKSGAGVESSTVLFKLANPDAEEALATARADMRAAEADLASLRARLEQELGEERARVAEARGAAELAKLEHDVDRQLLEQGAGAGLQEARSRVAADDKALRSRAEQERLTRVQESVTAQLRAQQARMDGLRKTLERRQEIVNDLEVHAGMVGILQRCNIEVGQSITAGTEVALVAKPRDLRAEIRIPEIDAHDLKLDQPVLIDAHNWTVDGVLERLDPSVRDGTVVVDVKLTGKLPEAAMADLAVEGLVDLDRLSKVRHVARPVNTRAESTTTVFKVTKDGMAVRVPVRLGKASVDRVVVLSGLSPGDQVIVSDMSDYAGRDRLQVR